MFNQIEKDLILFEKPGRYIGNEAGIPDKEFENAEVQLVLSYPDTYEIGMSNSGIRILYDIVNKLPYASCERVFSAWADFEKYLIDNSFFLYSLESKRPLKEFDIIGVSIQYELLFSNFLSIIDLGGVPLYAKDRTEDDPIVIIGGPAVSNPVPYYPFIDLAVIGEAEEVIVEILDTLRILKQNNASRDEKLMKLSTINGVLSPLYSKERVSRRIYSNFANDTGVDNVLIPSIDIVQNKLVIEIMRGCPNKCRFCQAGVLYKPYREKSTALIMAAIKKGLSKTGVKEVTFASLSTGDYSHIISLCDHFNNLYSSKGISVSLPSLKVESFNTEILERISLVRKSGLTFAIESGSQQGQLSINKRVNFDKIYNIIEEAMQKGWKLVKLYFMIGLPDEEDEVESIINCIDSILSKFKSLQINANISTFVPKPHTPYENVPQLTLELSKEKLYIIKNYYNKSRVRVKYHPPEMSYVEGFISRGDEQVGYAIEEAYRLGARFDGWNDHFNFKIYQEVFDKRAITHSKYLNGSMGVLPWKVVNPLVEDEYLIKERNFSKEHKETILCKEGCENECSICNEDVQVHDAIDDYIEESSNIERELGKFKYMLEFTKSGLSKYLSHKDLMRYFEVIFRMSDIQLLLSEGYNPHPRFQFSSALSLGIESNCELLEFFTSVYYEPDELLNIFQKIQNKDIRITRLRQTETLKKKSIYDNLYCTQYLIQSDESNSLLINQKISEFENNIEHILLDDDKSYNLKDFVAFNCDKKIIMTVVRVNPGPKLIKIVKSILFISEITIIKTNMLMKNEDVLKELYYLE